MLQAFVSEGVRPFLDSVVTFGAGHFYVSQSDKGGLVFGGDLDGGNSYAQRGDLATVEHVAATGVARIPSLSRLRLLRWWGGVMDTSMDGSPNIDKTPILTLYLKPVDDVAASRRRRPPAIVSPISSPATSRIPPPPNPTCIEAPMASLVGCPHCGPRPRQEFTFRGAALTRPAPGAERQAWFAYVYLRENPRGRYAEHGHRTGGCRHWLVVTRDTLTHEQIAVRDVAASGAGA